LILRNEANSPDGAAPRHARRRLLRAARPL
jgi:hypothetical protein